MAPTDARRWWVVAALVSTVLAVVMIVFTTVSREQADLQIYAGAIRAWLAGEPLYDYLKPGTPYGFTYPPFAALLLMPMSLVPTSVLIAVQAVVTTVALGAVIGCLLVPVARERNWPVQPVLAIGMAVAALLTPVRDTIGYGQLNLVLVALVLVDLCWLLPRGSRFAGVGVGLAAAIKLTPALFIGYLFLTQRYRAGFTALCTFVGSVVLGFVLVPHESAEFWFHKLVDTNRVGDAAGIYNQSLRGLVARLTSSDGSGKLWVLLCLVVLACWVGVVRRLAPDAELAGIAVTGVAMCLVSPITWGHHWVWTIPALVWLAFTWGTGIAVVAWALMIDYLPVHAAEVGGFMQVPLANLYVVLGLALVMASVLELSTRPLVREGWPWQTKKLTPK